MKETKLTKIEQAIFSTDKIDLKFEEELARNANIKDSYCDVIGDKMKENKFQNKVKKQLVDQGAFIINLHGHMMQRAGLPDLQVTHRKWNGFLELKVEQNKTSMIQRVTAAKIELRGVPVYVLRCVEGNELGVTLGNQIQCTYTFENFQGEVIETFYDLKELLGVLIELEKEKNNG